MPPVKWLDGNYRICDTQSLQPRQRFRYKATLCIVTTDREKGSQRQYMQRSRFGRRPVKNRCAGEDRVQT